MSRARLLPFEVSVHPHPLERFAPVISAAAMERVRETARRAKALLRGRTVWSINSTAAGGGVAEMMPHLLGYAKGAGVAARWLVIRGTPEFFAVTKRLHNAIHGSCGDGGPLGAAELDALVRVGRENLAGFARLVRPGDVAIVHDPQPAGLIAGLQALGVKVLWRSHIGCEGRSDLVTRAWELLRPLIEPAEAYCFTRASYAPEWMDRRRLLVVQPSIDPFSAKNQDLSSETVRAIVSHIGLVGPNGASTQPSDRQFTRSDGTLGSVERFADSVLTGSLPPLEAPLVVQVSRWDRLKDMTGVLHGFSDFVPGELGAYLALVGPSVRGVADDPEGIAAYDQCIDAWRRLPHFKRSRVQLVCLPMSDVEENGAMVNAIQRHACIVVQKSLQEGFGLAVTEAMWKGKAVLASARGGIQDQIEHLVDGLLVQDPADLRGFGIMLSELLASPERRRALGRAAHEKVVERFLPTRHIEELANAVIALR